MSASNRDIADADPHDRLVESAQLVPPGHATDEAHFQKNQSDREAASHPLTMLVDLAHKNEGHGNGDSCRPEKSVGGRCDAKGSSASHSPFKVLNIKSEGSSDEHADDLESSDNPMEPCEALAQAIRKLNWPQEQSACSSKSMKQQPPLKGLDVQPLGIPAADQKALIVTANINRPLDRSRRTTGTSGASRNCVETSLELSDTYKASIKLQFERIHSVGCATSWRRICRITEKRRVMTEMLRPTWRSHSLSEMRFEGI